MGSALVWGAVAASSLIIGAGLAFVRRWPSRQVGLVLAFGAGALISAVSFELAEEGIAVGSLASTAIGMAAGALTYFSLNRLVELRFGSGAGETDAGPALALGAFLDGIPEQLVLGIGLAAGAGVSPGLLTAIFVSNLPEAIGSATEMERAGASKRSILFLWVAVAGICAIATVAGFLIADSIGGEARSLINGFAAGALLVMLVDSMIPEATRDSGELAGLVTTLGFAVATALSSLT